MRIGRKWRRRTTGVAALIGMVALCFLLFSYPIAISSDAGNQSPQEVERQQRSPTSSQIFGRRKQQLREACAARTAASVQRPIYPYHRMWVSPFSFCALAKTGTTFWKRVLYYVDKGLTGPVLSHDYGDIHRHTMYMLNPNRATKDKTYKSIAFVREPYQRLFSAYVNKMFVPRFGNWIKYAKPAMFHSRLFATELDRQCSHNVTFAEFVHFFIHAEVDNDRTVRRDEHFVPISQQCNFCGINYDFIGRQETFAEDTLGILTQLNMSAMMSFSDFDNEYEKYEMDALIRYTFEHEIDVIAKQYRCMSTEEVLRRLWKSFQIHGTLGAEEFFPLAASDTKKITKEEFLTMALLAYNRTASKRSGQRNAEESLLEAYSTVPLLDREILKQIFEEDFRFFGYNPKHPSVFPAGDHFDLPYYRYLDVMDSFLYTVIDV